MSYTKEEAFEGIKALVEQFGKNLNAIKLQAHSKEMQVETEYIQPLFNLLNWNTSNTGLSFDRREVIIRASQKVGDSTKEPDYLLLVPEESTGKMRKCLFIEAKHPKFDLRRDDLIKQVYRYAHSTLSSSEYPRNHVRLALLTNFEEFRLFDCVDGKPLERGKSGLLNKHIVKPFDWKYQDYVSSFDLLWDTFERNNVFNRSLDQIKLTPLDAIKNRVAPDDRFLADLERWRDKIARSMWRGDNTLSGPLLTAAAQLIIDRLVFIKMLSDREVEEDYLTRLYLKIKETGKDNISIYQECESIFDKLDGTYNGSIFSHKIELDKVVVENKVLLNILEDLLPENSVYTLAVLPVEIIGNVYEKFLGKTINPDKRGVSIEKTPETEVRKGKGVVYTHKYIVSYIVANTLGEKLKKCQSPDDVNKLRILDPACGSGSFLLGAYESILNWYKLYYEKNPDSRYARVDGTTHLKLSLKRNILLNNIFGVDIDQQAIEVAQFSLSMKALEDVERYEIEEDSIKNKILPILSNNVQCGNSLVGDEYYKQQLFPDEEEKRRVNPFDWKKCFISAFLGNDPGFDIIVGNPPYISIRTLNKWLPLEASLYKKQYLSAKQGSYDIYVIFVERCLKLLRTNGLLGFILPNKFMKTNYGESLRDLLSSGKHIIRIIDFGAHQIWKTVATYTCLMFLSQFNDKDSFEYCKSTPSDDDIIDCKYNNIQFDTISSKSWSFGSEESKTINGKLYKNSTRLLDLPAQMSRGSSTGCDDVFIINASEVKLERTFLREPVFATSFNRYLFKSNESSRVIFPYIKDKLDKYRMVNENEMLEKAPKTHTYLKENKVLAPGHGFNSERSKQSENGGRP